MAFTWKILEVSAKEGLITKARYKVTFSDENTSVETEGNWVFENPVLSIPFSEVTEDLVISWVQKETTKFDENIIESNLQAQANNIDLSVLFPWLGATTYTPES